eukprot:2858535-Rhodomonas_salina.1
MVKYCRDLVIEGFSHKFASGMAGGGGALHTGMAGDRAAWPLHRCPRRLPPPLLLRSNPRP